MSLLARAFLVPAALSLWGTATLAKDFPGVPKNLLGTFAESPEDCRAYFKSLKSGRPEDQLVTVFREKDGVYTYGDCDVACFAEILNYRKIKKGYVVKMRWIGSGGNRIEHLSATRLPGNKFRFRFLPDDKPRDVVSCPLRTDSSSESEQ
jgi:hypothetical protein